MTVLTRFGDQIEYPPAGEKVEVPWTSNLVLRGLIRRDYADVSKKKEKKNWSGHLTQARIQGCLPISPDTPKMLTSHIAWMRTKGKRKVIVLANWLDPTC